MVIFATGFVMNVYDLFSAYHIIILFPTENVNELVIANLFWYLFLLGNLGIVIYAGANIKKQVRPRH